MAHQRGRGFPSGKLSKQRRNKRLAYLLVFILLLAGFSWGVAALSQSTLILISDIKVTGTNVTDPDEVVAIARKDLEPRYLYFISKNNTLLYPRSQMKQDIMAQFKRVKEVNIAIESNNVLHIEISERKPFALWCKTGSESKEECYFLDAQGFIFAKAPNFYGNVFFRYRDLIESTDPIGQTYMDSVRMKNLQDFARSVSELGLIPVGLHVRGSGEYEFMLEKGGKIIFTDTDPFSETLDNLATLIGNQPALKNDANVDYIDLRFGNKLFYKLRNM